MPMPLSRTRITPCRPSSSTRQPDVTAFVGELAGVVQQVADHLRETRRVGIQVDRLRRQRSPTARDSGSCRETARLRPPGWTIDASSMRSRSKIDLAARDAAHVEQVVHQARHLCRPGARAFRTPIVPRRGRRSPNRSARIGVADRGRAASAARAPASPGIRSCGDRPRRGPPPGVRRLSVEPPAARSRPG